MTTLPQPTDCCNPCAGARTACTVECDTSGTVDAVPTTAEARAFPGPYSLYQRLDKLGDTAPQDGFGVAYYFDTNSYAVDNGLSVLKPNSIDAADPGRWLQFI
jgi:hypothetical protein